MSYNFTVDLNSKMDRWEGEEHLVITIYIIGYNNSLGSYFYKLIHFFFNFKRIKRINHNKNRKAQIALKIRTN